MEHGIHRPTSSDRLLRRPEVENRTGFRRAYLYELMRKGQFPAPVRIGDRAVAWRESDIAEWINSRPLAREGK